MRLPRFPLFVGLLLGASLGLMQCGGSKCDAKSCATGCCDSKGVCQPGTATSACGTAAATCAACATGQSCLQNACITPGTGGGSGGGGGGTGGGAMGGGTGGGATGGGTGGGAMGGGAGGGAGDGGVTCTVSSADFADLGALPTAGKAYYDDGATPGDNTDDIVSALLPLESASPTDMISVELYPDYGVFTGGAIAPGTYTLSGDELNYSTCGVCVLVLTNLSSSSYDDDYMATGGTVVVTSTGTGVGTQFTATLTNVTFEHVTINSSYVSTPVGDGCVTSITNATFDETLAAPPP